MTGGGSLAAPGVVRRVHVIQGEVKVERRDPNVVLATLLGSCVAACIRDPEVGVGGMNHFLLPGDGSGGGGQSESYGLYLMELLVNGLMKKGARRHGLEAKLFGGARTVGGLSDIGAKNAAFARAFLDNEGIAYVGGSVGGDQGRRIEYWPASGRARQVLMEKTAGPARPAVFMPQAPSLSRAAAPAMAAPAVPGGGDLELF